MIIKFRRFLLRLSYLVAKVYWFVCNPTYRGAKVVVTCGGEMLLIRHSFDPSYWSFPGGTIEKGEEPEKAAIRETEEEVGIDLENVTPIGSFKSRGDHKQDTVYCFHAEVSTQDFVLNEVELAEARWFPIDTPPETLGRNNARRILDCYREYKSMLPSS